MGMRVRLLQSVGISCILVLLVFSILIYNFESLDPNQLLTNAEIISKELGPLNETNEEEYVVEVPPENMKHIATLGEYHAEENTSALVPQETTIQQSNTTKGISKATEKITQTEEVEKHEEKLSPNIGKQEKTVKLQQPPSNSLDINTNQTMPKAKKARKKTLTRHFYPSGHLVSVPERCPHLGAHVKLLIVVTSAPSHSAQRMAIRQTWGSVSHRKDVAMAFIVGITSKRKEISIISEEQRIYGDLIQGNFIDTYRNLTLKSLSILEWSIKFCPQASFVLKVDDDTFANVPKLMDFLDKKRNAKRSIFGRINVNSQPIRQPSSPWYVPHSQFAGKVYPNYLLGPAYIITRDFVKELYETALDTTYMCMEDVFITGVLPEILHGHIHNIYKFLEYYLNYPLDLCEVKETLFFTGLRDFEQYYLWAKIFNNRVKCY